MSQSIIIQDAELMEVLATAVSEKVSASMSHLSRGKWDSRDVQLCGVSDTTLHIGVPVGKSGCGMNISIDQPVGLSLLQGYSKYIFETSVIGFEPSVNLAHGGAIAIKKPESMERMQRRSYARISIPPDLHVKTLFWHRGYTDDTMEAPLEHYWQGDLMDLSAGGMQIEIGSKSSENFRIGQIVGLQFTPLPYEKPIMVEGQVKRIVQSQTGESIVVGVEFLGLESASDGRAKLHRIIDTINTYEIAGAESSL